MGSMGGFGGVWMVLWWGLVILAVVALARWLWWSSPAAEPPRKSPLDILRERYARGELDSEEFARRRRELDY